MKKIPKHSGYFADKDGNIYSVRSRNGRGVFRNKPRLLKPVKDSRTGYYSITLHDGKKPHYGAVHRLILETFVGECPPKMLACHNNGIPTDNRLKNLRWDTPKNNEADKIQHGTVSCGIKNGSSKLNEAQARVALRYCQMYGWGSQSEIARVFGVHSHTISCIARGKNWSHIAPDWTSNNEQRG